MIRALVTGASEGIGREFALRLAGRGYSITAVARNEARLKELLAELSNGGRENGGRNDNRGEHDYRVADLSAPEGMDSISELLRSKPYDLLVNNAGFAVYGPFHQTDLQALRRMTGLNIEALMALSHAFLQGARHGDALINVSSTLAFLPLPGSATYAATKAFVTSFSESLWQEQRGRGVFVMGLCPGITSTEFNRRAGGQDGDLPSSLTQTPAEVVRFALGKLDARSQPTVISGVKNRVFALASRMLSRRQLVSIMGGMMPDSRKHSR